MTVTGDVINSALCGLDTTLYTVEIEKFDKFGSKYSMHKIAHAKHWHMHMSSSEGVLLLLIMGPTYLDLQISRSKGAPVVQRGALPMSVALLTFLTYSNSFI